VLKTGTSDMNTVVAEGWRVPMAAYGPGDGSLDHGDGEYIEIADYLRGVAVLGAALGELTETVCSA
jgi:[amino group carrier protein]-lysine/ornithine hydrolase